MGRTREYFQDELFELFEWIENSFRWFQLHTRIESVMEEMKDVRVIVKIMVELLGIFGTATTIMNLPFRSDSSESTLDARWTIADSLIQVFSPVD